MIAAIAMGGGLPSIKIPESNTKMRDLPEGFKNWLFNRETGELLNDYPDNSLNPQTKKAIKVFQVVSRTEENARKEFKRLTK